MICWRGVPRRKYTRHALTQVFDKLIHTPPRYFNADARCTVHLVDTPRLVQSANRHCVLDTRHCQTRVSDGEAAAPTARARKKSYDIFERMVHGLRACRCETWHEKRKRFFHAIRKLKQESFHFKRVNHFANPVTNLIKTFLLIFKNLTKNVKIKYNSLHR